MRADEGIHEAAMDPNLNENRNLSAPEVLKILCDYPLFTIEFDMRDLLFESVLVCPVCGFAKRETMPTDACRFFYECVNCKRLLQPKPGDCCVFCSYGSVKCPPMQEENRAC